MFLIRRKRKYFLQIKSNILFQTNRSFTVNYKIRGEIVQEAHLRVHSILEGGTTNQNKTKIKTKYFNQEFCKRNKFRDIFFFLEKNTFQDLINVFWILKNIYSLNVRIDVCIYIRMYFIYNFIYKFYILILECN